MSDRFERIARRVIGRHGIAAHLVSTTMSAESYPGAGDGSVTEALTAITAAFSEVGRTADGSVSLGKRVAYITHEGVTPTTAMALRVDGTDYQIASVNTHAPDGEPRFHVVELNG